ncbi:alpha/beta fold hydrolase [Novosphingobium sp. KCTC 2891]|uniref:alpha/beta fold hydrolase n=1 Tax=unclassified Novosphingobium TaxID=2644732 RepID=UPI00222297B9|nr:alpha/beta fold hydrolase [Novosphingobium sp. KCTC 2891]MCW1384760.1 alpha/beta fold hydrolase [Novosphingobium sp. KCTC 2891]
MSVVGFKGFGGVALEADVAGDEHDPAILLVHGAGQTRAVWATVSDALVQAGRRVFSLDLRGHGGSEWPADGRYDMAAYVEDLRSVLAQMGSRPVVVASTLGGWIAALALSTDAANLAAGLVLVDMPVRSDPATAHQIGERLRKVQPQQHAAWDPRVIGAMDLVDVGDRLLESAPGLALPTMVLRGAISWVRRADGTAQFDAALPQAEIVEVEDADLLVVTDRTEAMLAHLLDFLERKQPRAAAEFRAGSDARTLRDAMGCFATGITIVTSRAADGTPVGLTANSFTSVSLDPPLLLVCLANNARSASILRDAEHFAVNVLQTSQQPASNRFAGKGEDRFAATAWQSGETGMPLLDGSLGSFECRRHAVHEAGDHFLLVGEVVRAQFEPRRDPLLYFRGKYRRLHMA